MVKGMAPSAPLVEDQSAAFARGKIAGMKDHAELVLVLIENGHTAEDLKESITASLPFLDGDEAKA